MKSPNLQSLISSQLLSSEVRQFWNDRIVPLHHALSYSSRVKHWEQYIPNLSINNFFENLKNTFDLEKENQSKSNISDDKFYSIEFLNLLKKENLDFTTILQNTLLNDPKNQAGWSYDLLLPLYASWLKANEQKIPNNLLDNFLHFQSFIKDNFSDKNKLVTCFFTLIDVLEDKNISYPWFKEHLDSFAYFNFDDALEKIDPKNYDISNHLNYQTQLKIFNFTQENFPEHLQENSSYYPHFFPDDFLETNHFFELSVKINLFKFAFENHLEKVDPGHLKNMIHHCLYLTNLAEFKNNIDQSLHISSSTVNKDSISPTSLIINISTETLEEQQKIQQFLIPTITSILKNSDKFYLRYDDNFNGPADVDTNLTLDVFSKHYLHAKFKSSMASHSQNNITTLKKQKL